MVRFFDQKIYVCFLSGLLNKRKKKEKEKKTYHNPLHKEKIICQGHSLLTVLLRDFSKSPLFEALRYATEKINTNVS